LRGERNFVQANLACSCFPPEAKRGEEGALLLLVAKSTRHTVTTVVSAGVF
jgi:hypothetical protein